MKQSRSGQYFLFKRIRKSTQEFKDSDNYSWEIKYKKKKRKSVAGEKCHG